MFLKLIFLCVSTHFVVSEAAFVDTLSQCQLGDQACFTNLLQKVLVSIPKNGLPEIGMPSIDPITIKEIIIKILDSVDLTLIGSVIRGIKNCIVNKFHILIDKYKATLDLTCDLNLKGKYKVFSASSLVRSLVGDNIHGEGNGKVEIEKFNVRLNFYFGIKKKGNDTYVSYKQDKTTYEYDVPKKMVFYADKLCLGKKEASEQIVKFLNDYWKTIVPIFAKDFMKQCISVLSKFIHVFFDNVPTRYYISDDMSSYVS